MNLTDKQIELCLFAINYLKTHSDIIIDKQFNKISSSLDRAEHILKTRSSKIDIESLATLHLALNILDSIANDEVDYNVDIITKHKCISNEDEINYLIFYFYNLLNG